jgi:hypothetical protein
MAGCSLMPQTLRDFCMAVVVLTMRAQLLRKMLWRELELCVLLILGGLPAIASAAMGSQSAHWFDVLSAAAGGFCIGGGVWSLMWWWRR